MITTQDIIRETGCSREAAVRVMAMFAPTVNAADYARGMMEEGLLFGLVKRDIQKIKEKLDSALGPKS